MTYSGSQAGDTTCRVLSHSLILFAHQSFTMFLQRLLIGVINNLLCVLPPSPSPTRAQAILDKETIDHHKEGGVEVRCRCVGGKKLGILLCSLCCWAFMVSAGTLGPWCECCGSAYLHKRRGGGCRSCVIGPRIISRVSHMFLAFCSRFARVLLPFIG